MIKKTFTYTDFFGNKREEDAYFNLNRSEIAEMDLIDAGNISANVKALKEFIMKAYGERSEDGKRFIKNNGELAKAWVETIMFDMLFTELTSTEDAAIEFIKGVVPADIAAVIDQKLAELRA